MAQWWSTSLPRRGSRVRSPSRALLIKGGYPIGISSFHYSSPILDSNMLLNSILLRFAPVGAKPRSIGPCAPSRAFKQDYLNYQDVFFAIRKCDALPKPILHSRIDSISQDTKVSFSRAKAEVQRTSWHPSRAFKQDYLVIIL